jgi:hypothetical protein
MVNINQYADFEHQGKTRNQYFYLKRRSVLSVIKQSERLIL